MDCIWLKPDSKLPETIQKQVFSFCYQSQQIIIVGHSGIYQSDDKSCCDISNIACISVDDNGHVKGAKKSSPGQSGAGVFDYLTGELVGMVVGSEAYTIGEDSSTMGAYGGKSEIIPIGFIAFGGGCYSNLDD